MRALRPDRPNAAPAERAAGAGEGDGDGAAPARADPDWLRSILTVSGPTVEVARFRQAARGTGAIPWHLDLDHEEARLLAPMAAAGIEARLLARELRAVVGARHERVRALWSQPGRCPLDLHRLIPVPDRILLLGEDSPAARTWLWTHWGTTQPLRQVRVVDEQPDRRLRRSARTVFAFPVRRLDALAGHKPPAPGLADAELRRAPALRRCLTTGPQRRNWFPKAWPIRRGATRCGTTGRS